MIRAVLFNGPPECGKDTITEMFQQYWEGNTCHVKFSQPLQTMLKTMCGNYAIPYEEIKRKKFKNGTGRDFMIQSFQKVIKPIFGEDHLGKLAAMHVESSICNEDDLILVSDAGRDAEVLAFMQEIGLSKCYVIQVHRQGKNFEGDSRQRAYHPWTDHNRKLVNDGSLAELQIIVAALVKDLEVSACL